MKIYGLIVTMVFVSLAWGQSAKPKTTTKKETVRPTAEPLGVYDERYDEFEKETFYSLTLDGKPPEDSTVPPKQLVSASSKAGQKAKAGEMLFMTVAKETWAYETCHAVKLLIDGNPVTVPTSIYDNTVNDGIGVELVLVPLSTKVILKIAGATSVKWKVCSTVWEWKPGNITAFYDWAEKVGFFK